MNIIKANSYDELSRVASNILIEEVQKNPKAVLGFATGGTPILMYKNIVDAYKAGEVDFSGITSFNLDEYCNLDRENNQSYWYYMKENLFNHINIKSENINIPQVNVEDITAECTRYNKKLEDKGPIDLQILGIGANGHIGFNEPDEFLVADTHKVSLSKDTISSNARFFTAIEDVPTEAVTMGVGDILKAKKILLLVNGSNKKPVVDQLFSGMITTKNPASLLLLHSNVTVIINE